MRIIFLTFIFSLSLKAQLSNPPKDSNIQFSDITTGNFSTTKHGFTPKGTNTGTAFLRDDATWAVPAGGGGSTNMALNSFTANGVSTTFVMSSNPSVVENTFVFLGGIYQAKSNYSVSSTNLIFSVAPVSGTLVEVMVGTVSGTSAGSVGGASGTVQYNNGGSFGGVSKVTTDGINISLSTSINAPSASANDKVKLYGMSVGGRSMLAQIGPSGLSTSFQPNLGRNRSVWWQPLGNATTVPITTGIVAASVSGTATTRNVATTNVLTRMKRLGYVSGPSAGSGAALYWPAGGQQYTLGNGSGLGGFHSIFRFATSDAAPVSGARAFAGWRTVVTAPTNVDPQAQINQIGVAQLSADNTQWYVVYGGSVSQTAIPLGTSLGSPASATTAWDVSFFSPPSSSSTVYYTMTNLGTNATVSGTLSGNNGTVLPLATTFMAPALWRNNNATAAAVGLDVSSIYIETDQ